MSERIKGCVVTFDALYKDEDADKIIEAISMIKGVSEVVTHIATPGDHMNRTLVRQKLTDKLWKALEDEETKRAS